MQPQEPTPTPTPTPPPGWTPTETAPAPGKKQTRRLRLWLAIGGGVIALLCLGGVGIAISLYDDATKIDRSRPDVATDSFLLAYLVNRDDKQAQLFTCSSPNLTNVSALRDQLLAREKKFNVKVSVSWGALTKTAVASGQEDVSTQLTISGSANGQLGSSRNEDWRFRVVDDGGSWRVCDASKIS